MVVNLEIFFGSQKKAKNNVLRIATRIFSAPTRTHSIFSILANQNYYCCCWPNFFFFKNRKISTADVDTMMMMIMMKSSEKAQVKTTIKYNDNKKKCKKKTLFFFLLKKKKRNQTANQCRQKNITFILTLFSPIHKGRKRKKLMTDKQLLVLFFCESKTFFWKKSGQIFIFFWNEKYFNNNNKKNYSRKQKSTHFCFIQNSYQEFLTWYTEFWPKTELNKTFFFRFCFVKKIYFCCVQSSAWLGTFFLVYFTPQPTNKKKHLEIVFVCNWMDRFWFFLVFCSNPDLSLSPTL